MGINDWRNQLFQVQMSVYAKAVGCAIASYYRKGQLCYPSIQTLCMDCCLSKPTVLKAIKELECHNFISIRKKLLKYLSAATNYYDFNGVDDSQNDGQSDGKSDGQSDGKSDGQSDGQPRLPEIRGNTGIREVRDTPSSDKSSEGVNLSPPVGEKNEKIPKTASYAFAGKIVRLSKRDFEAWEKAYSYLDLVAELQSRDDWLSGQPPDIQKGWFVTTSNYLRNRNDKARKEVEDEDDVQWATADW